MYLIMRRTYHYAFMFLLFGMGCDSNERELMATSAPAPSMDQSLDNAKAPINLDELSLGAGLSLDVGYDFPTEEELKALEQELRNQDYFFVAVNFVEEQFGATVESVKTVSFTANPRGVLVSAHDGYLYYLVMHQAHQYSDVRT